MKLTILLTLATLIVNCHTAKTSRFDNYKMDGFCISVLNDMEKRLYRIDQEFYGLRLYAPTYKERIDEFLQLDKNINQELNLNHKDCLKLITSVDIIGHFGQPNKVNKRDDDGSVFSILYRFNFGSNCPCENCIESEKHYGCNILDFNFDLNNRLININLSNVYHGLK